MHNFCSLLAVGGCLKGHRDLRQRNSTSGLAHRLRPFRRAEGVRMRVCASLCSEDLRSVSQDFR